MSLKSINIKSDYISLRDNIAEEFYVPVMSNSRIYYRSSCYFSLVAIARYCTGIYYLGKNGGVYRLLISKEVSEETFDAIRDGYYGRQMIEEDVREKMRQELCADDIVTLSNLAYLMKCGLVEIKFALCLNGLFHEKSGYAEDSCGNSLSFIGSNNETQAALDSNYEKFQVTVSWLASDFDKAKIVNAKREFEECWDDKSPYVKVFNPPESFESFIQTFNRGGLVENSEGYLKNAFYLDFSEGRVSVLVPDAVGNLNSMKFQLEIQSKVERIEGKALMLRDNLSKHDIRVVEESIKNYALKHGHEILKSEAFLDYLGSETLMEKLALVGLSIKRRDPKNLEGFHHFRDIVGQTVQNNLREEQLWDAYFAYRLGKSANFSVPGSGKTATALGMFAYLHQMKGVKRLFVIGPLNSYDSWIFEFKRVFGNKLPLEYVTSVNLRETGNPLPYSIRYSINPNCNLVLLNYESFDNFEVGVAVMDRINDQTMLVLDEVHRIKALGGKRASNLVPSVKDSKYTLVMTGTPIPNSYSDVFNFLHILYSQDYDDYFRLSSSELSVLSGQDAIRFNDRLRPFYCRTTKNKLNVPSANEDNIKNVIATDEEHLLFEKLLETYMHPLVRIIRILQLESNPEMLKDTKLEESEELTIFEGTGVRVSEIVPIDGAEYFKTAKVMACVDLVKSLVASGKQVIIWCIFIKSIFNLSKLLSEEGIDTCVIYGATENRQQIINDFKSKKGRVLITNPQTLGESISLHDVCHDAVYFEYSYNLTHFLQSKDRIHRLGLAPNQYTQYHFLETQFRRGIGTVSLDGEIHRRLNHKEKVMLEAIENDSLESFASSEKEIKSILKSMGIEEDLQL